MRKKLKQTITIGTAIAGSVLLVNVPEAKANETTESTATTPDSELITKTKEGKTTAKDVEVAKVKSDTAKEKADALTETVAEKTAKAKSAEEKVSKLESTKKAADLVTPEKIKELESEITKTTAEKTDKEKELAEKQADLKAKQTDLNTEKQGLETAKTNIQDKKAKADELRGKIKELDPSLKELEDKKAEKVELEKKVKDLNADKKDKEDKLRLAKEKDKAIADEKAKANSDMNKQKEVLDNAKADEQTAKVKETEAKSNLDSNVKLFKYGKKDIALSPEFVEAFKKYLNHQITLEELKAIELKALENDNYIYEKDQAGDETVDVNNLSEKDKEEFSQYFVYLLNQVRAQFGLEPRKVNKNTQRLADDIAKYSRTSTYNKMGHDKESIKKAARDHGLREGQFYENLITSTGSTDAINYKGSIRTKREIYNDLHNAIFDFFYEGNVNDHYLHARSLLNSDPTTALSFSYKTLVDPDTNENVYHLRLHVISVSLSTVVDKSTAEARYGKTSKDNLEPLKVPSQAELQKAYDTAKAEVQRKAEQVKVEQAKYDSLVNKVKSYDNVVPSSPKAQTELDNVTKELAKVQAELDKVVKVIKTLEDQKAVADEKVRQLQGQLDTLTNEIKALEDNLVAKEQAVRNAEVKVEEAKTEIANLTSDIQSLTDKLANLEREHTSALELRAKYEKIAKDLEIAKEELALAKEELDLEKEKLEDANTKAEVAYDKYIAIKKQHELEKLTYAVTKDTPVLEKPEFHFEIPKDAPVLEKPEFHFEIPKDAPVLEKPEFHFEIPKDAPVLEKPEFKPGFALPHDAPILEKPEFDINSLNKPTKPVNSTNSTTIVEKVTSKTEKGATLPKTGENSKSSVAMGLMVLVASLVLNRRKAK